MAAFMGVVIQKERGGRVRIVANRKVVCGDCGRGGRACRSCLATADLMECEASDPVGAETGDLVKLKMPSLSVHARAAVYRVACPGFRPSDGSVWTHDLPAV